MQIGRGTVAIALLAAVGAIAYFAVDPKAVDPKAVKLIRLDRSSSGDEVAKFCRSNHWTMASSLLNSWLELGWIVRYTKQRIEVEEQKWAAIDDSDKLAIAVMGYCNALVGTNSDRATVLIRGYRDGAIKASIVDGKYSDA